MGFGQIGGGVTGLEGGSCAAASQHHAEERERKDSGFGSEHDGEGSNDTKPIGKQEAGPPTTAIHKPGNRNGDNGSTHDPGS